jgi:precorrin-6x reductase
LYEATLADRERVLGRDHPITRTSRRNLALVLVAVGRTEEAISLYEEIAARSLKTVGAEHLETRQAKEEAHRLRRMIASPGKPPVVGGSHGEG